LSWAAPQLKRLLAGFPPQRPRFALGSGQKGFAVDKVVLGQVSSEYFGFPCQSSLHQILHPHNNRGKYNRPEVADEPSGPSLDSTSHHANLKKKMYLLSSREGFININCKFGSIQVEVGILVQDNVNKLMEFNFLFLHSN
jgi:hypothetical protein